ncbi:MULTISPECIES: hypothetical protein [Mesonia]|uniref:Uncharacterized protein n=1 Tax=Mesonia oceanica TaxID=2687242 RepID=A0AC61YB49_9FLAO|nr:MULTISPECIES: hypothetical protein [Mesonia]MAN26690.1 hypothetical protein [Mesonia sp.]MAQ39808.1 hypothetical protein [Mesonia sp.]MBJ96666.1 hypothetical protein [Flavobacteriaceae bacterium]VVV01363.1 hypothetical protein FVB9532_02653 [Mesonia oceanica]|tara:strand:- start:160 stop:1188 length:1029 start_codon:yes stop_codon:yes gene_type:complete
MEKCKFSFYYLSLLLLLFACDNDDDNFSKSGSEELILDGYLIVNGNSYSSSLDIISDDLQNIESSIFLAENNSELPSISNIIFKEDLAYFFFNNSNNIYILYKSNLRVKEIFKIQQNILGSHIDENNDLYLTTNNELLIYNNVDLFNQFPETYPLQENYKKIIDIGENLFLYNNGGISSSISVFNKTKKEITDEFEFENATNFTREGNFLYFLSGNYITEFSLVTKSITKQISILNDENYNKSFQVLKNRVYLFSGLNLYAIPISENQIDEEDILLPFENNEQGNRLAQNMKILDNYIFLSFNNFWDPSDQNQLYVYNLEGEFQKSFFTNGGMKELYKIEND